MRGNCSQNGAETGAEINDKSEKWFSENDDSRRSVCKKTRLTIQKTDPKTTTNLLKNMREKVMKKHEKSSKNGPKMELKSGKMTSKNRCGKRDGFCEFCVLRADFSARSGGTQYQQDWTNTKNKNKERKKESWRHACRERVHAEGMHAESTTAHTLTRLGRLRARSGSNLPAASFRSGP